MGWRKSTPHQFFLNKLFCMLAFRVIINGNSSNISSNKKGVFNNSNNNGSQSAQIFGQNISSERKPSAVAGELSWAVQWNWNWISHSLAHIFFSFILLIPLKNVTSPRLPASKALHHHHHHHQLHRQQQHQQQMLLLSSVPLCSPNQSTCLSSSLLILTNAAPLSQ